MGSQPSSAQTDVVPCTLCLGVSSAYPREPFALRVIMVAVILRYYELLSEDPKEPTIYWMPRLFCLDIVLCQLASRS